MSGLMGGGGTNSDVSPALTSLPVQSSVYGLTIPVVRGKTRVPANLIWYGDFTSTAHTSSQSAGGKGGGAGNSSSTTYTYSAGIILAVAKGAYTLGQVWKSKNLFASLAAAGLSQSSGAIGQAVWGWLATTNPSQALGYSGLTYVYAPSYDLGSSSSLENHSFEVASASPANAAGDVSPALAMQDILQNEAAFPVAMIGSVTAWDTYAKAQGLLVSLAFDAQQAASDWLRAALDVSHSDCTFSQGVLKFVPLGDKAVTGNGATYTPNNTPVYDLDETVFVTEGDEDPLTVEIKSDDDTYNCIKVEYTDRADQYNLQIVEARDAADVDRRGLRVKSTVQAHAIHDAATANTYAALLLQIEQGVRRTFKFKLPWTYALLEPLDPVTITDPFMGLYRVPARVNMVTELDNGNFEVEAEDCPIGMTTAPTYGSQAGQGFAHDYNATPGNVTTPTFFEPPIEITTTGLEVWAAVSGSNANWGGCNVWASLDGLSYKKVDTIHGGARYGTITGALAAGGASVGVALIGQGGTMLPASSTDAAQNASLCFVGTSAGGEFFNHVGAALTSTNAYTLSGLARGAYSSYNVAHASGQQFVRVDQAIAKSDPLDLSMIGQTIHFKFTSFNIYTGAEQDISAVTDYTYTVTGAMANLPPPNVDTFQIATGVDGTRIFTWAWTTTPRPVDLAGYRIRYRQGTGWTWADMRALDTDDGFFTISPHETNLILAGAYTFAIKTVDLLGNESAAAQYITGTLSDPRLGSSLFAVSADQTGWAGTKTNCHVDGTNLVFDSSTTWATLPSTWDAWTDWLGTPVGSSIVYQHTDIDVGFVVTLSPVVLLQADGSYIIEEQQSTDNITWTSWAVVGAAISARYLRVRVTLTGSRPVMQSLTIYGAANTVTETLSDVVVSSGALGAKYLGTGDIRAPITAAYTNIREVSAVFQSVSGNWGYEVLDKDATLGPRIRFWNPSNALANPPAVDIYIKGVK